MNRWIRVTGIPIPQGSKTARVVGGRAVMWDSNPQLRDWRENVQLNAWQPTIDNKPDPCPEAVAVTIWFYLPKPKTVKRDRPSVKPDIDKLARAVLDSMTNAGVWNDDSQVVELSCSKLYADEHTKPGAMIHVRTLDANQ